MQWSSGVGRLSITMAPPYDRNMIQIVGWYVTCAVVGAASSWLGGFFVVTGISTLLLVFGIVISLKDSKPRPLALHHAVFGLAVASIISHALPVAVMALGPGI